MRVRSNSNRQGWREVMKAFVPSLAEHGLEPHRGTWLLSFLTGIFKP